MKQLQTGSGKEKDRRFNPKATAKKTAEEDCHGLKAAMLASCKSLFWDWLKK